MKLVPNAETPAADATDEQEIAPDGLAGLSPEERSQKILSLILQELDDDKAENIVTIDLEGKSDIADAMVIATGRSRRHVGAIADKIIRRLKEIGFGRARAEGQPACDWVLIDAVDVIVHLFRPEVRSFYNLERIWSETARAPAKADA
ncbi:MAG: ribosome silencing factor [Parvularculaceae bacterium]